MLDNFCRIGPMNRKIFMRARPPASYVVVYRIARDDDGSVAALAKSRAAEPEQA